MARIAVPLALFVSGFALTHSVALNAQPSPPANSVFVIRGTPKTCPNIGQLSWALSSRNASYFAGWSDADYDAAAFWAASCARFDLHAGGVSIVDELRMHQQRANAPAAAPAERGDVLAKKIYAQEVADNQAQRAKEQEDAREQAAEKAAADARAAAQAKTRANERRVREAALTQCHSTDAYILFAAQQRVIMDQVAKIQVTQDMDEERKIEQVSGVENMNRKYRDGANIVQIDEALQRDWRIYHQYGGKAQSLDDSVHLVSNPCPK